MSKHSKRLRPGDKGYKKRSFGEDRTTHSRLVIKVPPPELIALREEFALHKDIYDYAITGNSFEECCAMIAEKLDILLDGLYDGDKLCGVLLEALRNRRFHGNQPHLRAKGLVNVELVERKDSVTLEVVKEGTIAPTASFEEVLKAEEATAQQDQETGNSSSGSESPAEESRPSLSESADSAETSSSDTTDSQQKH